MLQFIILQHVKFHKTAFNNLLSKLIFPLKEAVRNKDKKRLITKWFRLKQIKFHFKGKLVYVNCLSRETKNKFQTNKAKQSSLPNSVKGTPILKLSPYFLAALVNRNKIILKADRNFSSLRIKHNKLFRWFLAGCWVPVRWSWGMGSRRWQLCNPSGPKRFRRNHVTFCTSRRKSCTPNPACTRSLLKLFN